MTAQWKLEKKFTFEAAHILPHHDGKCGRLHGHSWGGSVLVTSDKLQAFGPKQGMVIDYGEIKAVLSPIIEMYLDHHFLNDSLGLENPTSEEIARWLFKRLQPMLPGLSAVIIEETCTSACIYSEA